ncbi:hypothetical protein GGS20DRAFT_447273 [Poronia punctata]|nr:hypothetical protein GGS20DRAFT_447273 [Poronia punctata]
MSRLSPPPQNLDRSQSPASLAASDTTYHSFYEVELFEPGSPPPTTKMTSHNYVMSGKEMMDPKQISRQDSGYESASISTSAKTGTSQSSRGHSTASTPATTTTTSSSSSSSRRGSMRIRPQKQRPSIHRTSVSTPNPLRHTKRVPASSSSSSSSHQQEQQQITSYYYFPPPEGISDEEAAAAESQYKTNYPPPQTTHYWMSDHTRRLEYAAIDAASRGVRGWVMKHVVPDCFVPRENRRVTFDDDSGSVRRYRLELDEDHEDDDVKKGKDGNNKKFGWLFGRS